MIVEYHRPTTIEAVLSLLNRIEPRTLPLGGGTVLNQPGEELFAVVDLQNLGLNFIERSGNLLQVGATTTLQALLDSPEIPSGLNEALLHEATINIRQAATVAGTVVAGDGRSSFLAALLALDVSLLIHSLGTAPAKINLGDWLPLRKVRTGNLIVSISMPLNVRLSCQVVARTPADLPIVGAAVARWPAGRTRLALYGWGNSPVLAMDGPEPGGIELAAQNAASHAADSWASAEYRQSIAGILALRALRSVTDGS